MKHIHWLLTVALVGCTSNPLPTEGPEALSRAEEDTEDRFAGLDFREAYYVASQMVHEDLMALEELELFEVHDIVLTRDMQIGFCYGPCDDDRDEVERFMEQALRLHAFVDLADDDPEELGPCYTTASFVVDESLARLEKLDLVDIGERVLAEPDPLQMFYGVPIPEEEARVNEENERRALAIWHLAERSQGL